jgi:hypothetical protein
MMGDHGYGREIYFTYHNRINSIQISDHAEGDIRNIYLKRVKKMV